jgi:uncharacterized protein YfaS (alpha-2-macroglobulin family)
MTRRAFVLSLIVAALLPTAAQEQRPYFSLSTNRTFAPGETPAIQMWSQNVDALEFRVYRIQDPLAFFRKLENVHGFGAGERPQEVTGETTGIERFHAFKRRMRARLRNALRAQFSAEARAAVRTFAARREQQPLPAAAQYATGLPLLNPQQVVAVWRQPVSARRRWESQSVPIAVSDKALYLVEAVHGELRAYTVVLITDLAVITKSAPGAVLAFAANRRTGQPVPDCPVWLWAKRQQIGEARTDRLGLAEFLLQDADPGDPLILARHGDDFAVSNLHGWNLGNQPERFAEVYLYTDRPIYRPGHTVHWKAVVRNRQADGFGVPAGSAARAEVSDPEGKTIYRKDVTLSPHGTASGSFEIAGDAALGYHSLELQVGEARHGAGFHVEEYRKPEYEVRVTPEKLRVLQGEPILARIQARYFFGEPVRNAKVQYVVHRQRYWYPLYAEEMDESGFEGDEDFYSEREQVLEEEGQLDAEGVLMVRLPAAVSDRGWDQRYRVEARVTDAANRQISGAAGVIATVGSFLVHVQPAQYVYESGQQAAFDIETRDYDGQPVSARVQVELVRARGRTEPASPPAVAETSTDSAGKARVTFPVREPGSYTAHASARTPENRTVRGSAWIWVSSPGGSWYGAPQQRLTLVPDKKSYQPGEVAKVLIVTGVPGARLLVTTEGQRLATRQVVEAPGATVTVEVPVRREFSPNFFVSAVFVKDNQMFEGAKKVRVPAADRQLQIDIEPSKREFKPGEPAVYRISARNSAGAAVPGAEVSLGVVDEAIYAIRPDPARDLFLHFWGSAPNRVATQSSLSYYFFGQAGRKAMPLAEFRRASYGQLKPEALLQPRIRKAFPDTIYWAAALVTDANGRAEARFSFPDSLTTWRATARAITRDTAAGSATQKTIVRKNLMLRLSTPRFLTQGDEVTISALTHNYLKGEKTARVSLEVRGAEVLDGATRDLAIPPGGEGKAAWRLRATQIGEVILTGKALTDEESDGLEIKLPVQPRGVKLAVARTGSVRDPAGEAVAEIAFPGEIEPSSRAIELTLNPSVAGAMFGALEYLVSFPYGCTEQTMSSFLPNVVVSQALRELNIPSGIDAADLKRKVRAGLDRLYEYQHEDGGWGWWPEDESHPFMSAYVVAGFAQAQTAGYAVREEALERGQQWLRRRLQDKESLHADLRAYLTYALAGAGGKDAALLDAAWNARGQMTAYGWSVLGLALHAAGDPRAAEAAAHLEKQARADERDAFWPVEHDHLLGFRGDTSTEATAHALKLLVRAKPGSPVIAKAAHWLATHRDEGFYWRSTKQTAMVIYGLTDYLRQSGELQPDYTLTVFLNGRQVHSRRVTAKEALNPNAPPLRFSAADLAAGANQIRVTKQGTGLLYWAARGEFYSTARTLEETGSAALGISREYFRLLPVGEGGKIVHRLEPLDAAAALQTGDVLAVRLRVSGSGWNYLLLEDPIPAGMEAIDKDDLYTLKERPPWWQYAYARREFRDNRVALFQTYLPRRGADHFYLLRAVNPGRYQVNPARVQPMYQPEYLATSESREVEVR